MMRVLRAADHGRPAWSCYNRCSVAAATRRVAGDDPGLRGRCAACRGEPHKSRGGDAIFVLQVDGGHLLQVAFYRLLLYAVLMVAGVIVGLRDPVRRCSRFACCRASARVCRS
jgi:hypothetical protein